MEERERERQTDRDRDWVGWYPRRMYVEILQRAPGRHRLPLTEKGRRKERDEKETDGEKKVDGGGRQRFQLDSTCHAEDLFSTVYYVPLE